MRVVRTLECTKNYQLNVYEFWSDHISALIKSYGILNVNTEVIEYGPSQSLDEAMAIIRQLENINYTLGEQPIGEPLDPEVKSH